MGRAGTSELSVLWFKFFLGLNFFQSSLSLSNQFIYFKLDCSYQLSEKGLYFWGVV